LRRERQIRGVLNVAEPVIEKQTRASGVVKPNRRPRHTSRAWPEIRTKMHKAPYRALFLDFDGTLVRLQRRPDDVKLSAHAKRILARLARRDNVFVAIVSGRKRSDLIRLVGVKGVHLFGLQGAERAGKKPTITAKTARALVRAKRQARSLLASIPGIWIEDKGAIFTVHYRAANRAGVERARKLLLKILAPSIHCLHMLNGAKTWEILPIQIRGKGAAVEAELREMPEGTIAVYIGDDGTDETALAVLKEHISVRVGEKKDTKANFYLRDPSEVLGFLSQLEREIL
jgi:trehalose 6-phosphate phosphatase